MNDNYCPVCKSAHTGRNVVVHSQTGAKKFERVVCICTDEEPIVEKTS